MNVNWNEVLSPLLTAILSIVVTSLLPLIVKLTQRGFKWIDLKTDTVKNDYVRGLLDRLETIISDRVQHYENTAIEDLKEMAQSGKLSWAALPEALKSVKDDVLAEIKDDATAQNLWNDLLLIFGGNEQMMKSYLSKQVETHVAKLPPSNLQTGPAPAMAKAPMSAA